MESKRWKGVSKQDYPLFDSQRKKTAVNNNPKTRRTEYVDRKSDTNLESSRPSWSTLKRYQNVQLTYLCHTIDKISVWKK